jgi:heme-degrading monooxygenase HmoA
MHARVTTVQGDPAKADEGIAGFRDGALPIVREAGGFKGALLLIDRETGKGIALTLWDSEEAMKATEEAVKPQRERVTEEMGAETPTVDRYEVAVLEMP